MWCSSRTTAFFNQSLLLLSSRMKPPSSALRFTTAITCLLYDCLLSSSESTCSSAIVCISPNMLPKPVRACMAAVSCLFWKKIGKILSNQIRHTQEVLPKYLEVLIRTNVRASSCMHSECTQRDSRVERQKRHLCKKKGSFFLLSKERQRRPFL